MLYCAYIQIDELWSPKQLAWAKEALLYKIAKELNIPVDQAREHTTIEQTIYSNDPVYFARYREQSQMQVEWPHWPYNS